MGYYDLARHARAEIARLKGKTETEDVAERKMWEERLADLGIRVASALVEMEDLEGATYHLGMFSSTSSQPQHLSLQKVILWLRIGNAAAARRCVSGNAEADAVVAALADMADGKYKEAVEAWKHLCEEDSANGMYRQNLAVCLLYMGRMDEVCYSSPILSPTLASSQHMN